MRLLLWSLVIVCVAELPRPTPVYSCAAAVRRGEFVGTNAEEAIILYDAETKTQHFIRRVDFRAEVKDFGFLVPTPTRPELGEAPGIIFSALFSATQPRRVESGNVQRIVRKRGEAGMVANKAPRILDQQQVAGLDAVVLQADDVDGLKKWLEDNQYDARPALMEWVKKYVDNKWILTAFKIAPGKEAERDRWQKAVRMSFKTETPFYPYREPEDMRDNSAARQRQLRVYFLADKRFEGTLGKDGAWPAKTMWADACPAIVAEGVLNALKLEEKQLERVKELAWHLTEFEDLSAPRPGTDEVYFRPSADQATVERPVIYYDRFEYVDEEEPAAEGMLGLPNWALFLGGVTVLVGFSVLGALFFILRKPAKPV